MAHFAQLNDEYVVTQVLVVNNDALGNLEFPESEPHGIAFCRNIFGADTNWVQTSYNKSFRKNYAGIGYKFDSQLDAFIPTKPYPSWSLNEETCLWEAPVPRPEDEKIYSWDESTLSWVIIGE